MRQNELLQHGGMLKLEAAIKSNQRKFLRKHLPKAYLRRLALIVMLDCRITQASAHAQAI